MAKYLIIAQQYWQNVFVYRASFVLWRLREFISSLMSLTIWQVIFTNQEMAFGYQQNQIISYIFLASILRNIIITTSLNNLAGDIYSGDISVKLLKPMNIFLALGSQDLADKVLNFGFVILESLALYLIFKPMIIFPSLGISFVLICWIIIAVLIGFIINLLFGTVGFWSPDSWGPKFLFYMFLDFTAGKLYPLDILPSAVQKIIYLTPFPYLSYTQTQLFLGRLETSQIIPTTLIMIAWCFILVIAFKIIWRNGLKNYTAMGQ